MNKIKQPTTSLPLEIALRDLMNVRLEDILFLKGEANYTRIYLRDGRNILTCKTLKSFEDALEVYGFMRVHKGCVINLRYVTAYDHIGLTSLKLEGDVKVEISRRRRIDFKKIEREFRTNL
jgi:DNA-binding LytR/AlgR family response regulator